MLFSRWILRLSGLMTAVFCLLLMLPARAQNDRLSLTIEAGFDGQFRENRWLPVFIRASNDGPDIEGRFVVRPETSGSGIANAYSVPISLPQGARKTAFLYVTARGFASSLRVDLLAADDVLVTSAEADLRAIQPNDRLYVVVSDAAAGAADLTGASTNTFNAYQASWRIENIPDRAAALEAVDVVFFTDVDTGALSSAQRQALTDWTAAGGHLIAAGGANWQATAAGLSALLPLQPSDSRALDNLADLAGWLRAAPDSLSAPAIIAVGDLRADALALVAADETPLIARRDLGLGTVDYLAFDPGSAPLRGWPSLRDLWLALLSTTAPQPAWSFGIFDWNSAVRAAEVMPGVNLLPDILPLCGFLALYIALIGPLNYAVLNRINRRELAWITIPAFIILFSALSWVIGADLRGTDVTISRLAVVQSWPDTDHAQVTQIIGLLSPRRDRYSLTLSGDSFLRPLPRATTSSGVVSGGALVGAEIIQSGGFRADDFPVDASFIAAFSASATIEKPAISGQARLFFDGFDGQQVMRGSVRNDSGETLTDAIILARGASMRLSQPLAPGDVATFDLTLPGEMLPAPSPIAYAPGGLAPLTTRSSGYRSAVPPTISDLLNTPASEWALSSRRPGSTPAEQEAYRRRLLLNALISDPFNSTAGRGQYAYLAGWTNRAPLDFELEGAAWSALDSTLLLVQLDVTFMPPLGEVLIPAEQFTWTAETPSGLLTEIAPFALSFQTGEEAVFRFAPLPQAVLSTVSELIIRVDRSVSVARTVPLQVWNWETAAWEELRITSGVGYPIRRPQPYLGPNNAVQIRITGDSFGGYTRLQDLTIEQRGRY